MRLEIFFFPTFQAELIDPALKGTLNVLSSCAKVPSLKRVVLTSSMASVMFNGKPLALDMVVDETWFSDLAFCEASKVHKCVDLFLLVISFQLSLGLFVFIFEWNSLCKFIIS